MRYTQILVGLRVRDVGSAGSDIRYTALGTSAITTPLRPRQRAERPHGALTTRQLLTLEHSGELCILLSVSSLYIEFWRTVASDDILAEVKAAHSEGK